MCRLCEEGRPQDHARVHEGSRRDFLKASGATAVAATGLNLLGASTASAKDDNAQGIDNSSGVAKLVDFERVNALLASKADSLELVENRIAQIVAAWAGETVKNNLITYPDSFDVRGLYEEFDISTRLMLVDAPKSVRQEQMKSVLDKLFPQLAADLRAKMEKDQ